MLRLPSLTITSFALTLAASMADAAPADPQPEWTLRAEGQLPVIAANHAVGGFGFGFAAENGRWAINGEAQILPIVVCDSACGNAYAAGVGSSVSSRSWRGLSSHLELLLQYYAHPGLHQYVPALGPRIGLRWPEHGTAISLDAGVSLVARRNFDSDGFARNKVLGWGIPELILGLWF